MNALLVWKGVLLAAGLSMAGLLGLLMLSWLVGVGLTLKFLMAGLTLIYILALVGLHRVGAGKLLVLVSWLSLTVVLMIFNPGLLMWLVCYTALIWGMRACVVVRGAWAVVLDGALSSAAFLAALASWYHTHSIAWSLWAYFLVQAMHPWLVSGRRALPHAEPAIADFEQASRAAEAALARLLTR